MRHLLLILAVLFPALFVSAAKPDDLPAIPAPVIPDRTFNITDYGALPDGKTINTDAIVKAISAATAAGGGRVLIPAGSFLTGPFALASNIDLHLDAGSVLRLSDKTSDYPLSNNRYKDCITAVDCHDLSITGEGTIDGQGKNWWTAFRGQAQAGAAAALPDAPSPHRPFLVAIRNTRRLRVTGITIQNSPMFNLVPQSCRDVLIDGITIKDPSNSPNTDGIDPSGWNFLITNCHIDVGDDCIALKPNPGNARSSLKPAPDSLSCEDFLITHCTFLHGHGMSIGNPSAGGVRRLLVRDCTFDGTDTGIRLKSQRGKGGVVEDLTYENLTMIHIVKDAILITSYYPTIPNNSQNDPAQPADANTPVWRNIKIKNVTASGSKQAARIIGLAEAPITGLTLENVTLSGQTGIQFIHAHGVQCTSTKVTAAKGEAVVSFDSDVTGLP